MNPAEGKMTDGTMEQIGEINLYENIERTVAERL
jgi:hypothetical protein